MSSTSSTVVHLEEGDRASSTPYECGVACFRENSRGHTMGIDIEFLKLIFARDTRIILLGTHMFGVSANELIHFRRWVIV